MRFVDGRYQSRGRVLCAALIVLALGACGASAPRRAGEPARSVIAAAAAPAEQAPAKEEHRRGRKADAAKDVAADPAIAPVPDAATAAYARALGAAQAANWVQAELELEQLVHAYPRYAAPHVSLAVAYLHDGRRDDARAALDAALAIDPGHPAANDQLGILLREQGKFEDAERAYRRALATDPSYGLAHYNLGVLLDVYLRRPAEALEQYEQYQSSLAEPDVNVARWIVDLKRRAGSAEAAPRVAQGDGQ
jgi:Tfp pilus assembly protein PilF